MTMSITQERKTALIEEYATAANDTSIAKANILMFNFVNVFILLCSLNAGLLASERPTLNKEANFFI